MNEGIEISLKKTPLSQAHEKLGAKMVDFGGWYMPVQYTNVIEEHNITRTKAGLFDICHMGEFIVSGNDAKDFLQKVCVNDLDKLVKGKAQYSMFCNPKGGVVDDIFIYMLDENKFMVVTNAGTIKKDYDWMKLNSEDFEVEINDISDNTSKLDIQGPKAEVILQKVCGTDLSELKRFFYVETELDGVKCKISRTGYTGEAGFEIYSDAEYSEQLWNRLLEVGEEDGLKPIGLGARDTLRLEACYSLYGHELSDSITPIEASLSWIVPEKEFIGSDVVLNQKKEGSEKINVAFEMVDRAVPREHYNITKDGEDIGEVSSGSFSPTFKKGLGLCFVKKEFSEPDTEISIMIRDKPYAAKVVKKPFYAFNG